MKKVFIAALLGLSIVACTPKGGAQSGTAADLQPTKAQLDSVSYLIGIQFGSFLKNYDMSDLSWTVIKQGIDDFMKSEGSPYDENFGEQFKVDPNEMNTVISAYLQKKQEYKLLVNKEAGEKFLEANKAKANVQTTESGLQYKIITPGNEKRASLQDTVVVRYKGTTIDGKVFDEVKDDADPIKFTLGGVIKGWQEGMQLVGEGGEIELYVPSDLAYGENGNRSIEPNSTLIFNVKLAEIRPVAPAEPAE
jgi:FKBP-type peptidyl-prolyl cis-trans isomerase FklB